MRRLILFYLILTGCESSIKEGYVKNEVNENNLETIKFKAYSLPKFVHFVPASEGDIYDYCQQKLNMSSLVDASIYRKKEDLSYCIPKPEFGKKEFIEYHFYKSKMDQSNLIQFVKKLKRTERKTDLVRIIMEFETPSKTYKKVLIYNNLVLEYGDERYLIDSSFINKLFFLPKEIKDDWKREQDCLGYSS